MNNENLYDALEICLEALEQGADVESCLVRFPTLAEELRPLLETAIQARSTSLDTIPADVIRRGKARVLQAAAEMREQKRSPLIPFWKRKFSWGRTFRLTLASLAVLVFLATGGTGLVRASSGTVPGDQLYPVKRTWEGLRLFLALDGDVRERLASEFEQERAHEVEELVSEGRREHVTFQGVVNSQQGRVWVINGIAIQLESEVVIDKNIIPGSLVQVVGETDNNVLKADSVALLATPVVTPMAGSTSTPPTIILIPTLEEHGLGTEATGDATEQDDSGSTNPSDDELYYEETETPTSQPGATYQPTPTKKPKPEQSDNSDSGNSGSENGNDQGGEDDHGENENESEGEGNENH